MQISFTLTLDGNKPKLSEFTFYDEEDLEDDDDEDIDFGED